MAGIVAGDCLPTVPDLSVSVLSVSAALTIFLVTVVAALLTGRYRGLQSAALLLSTAALGVLLTTLRRQQLRVEWPEGWHTYEAVVISEPQEKPQTIAVDLLLPASRQKIKAYIRKDERSRQLSVGDGLLFRSRIEQPPASNAASASTPSASSASSVSAGFAGRTFDYRRYLLTHGFTGTAYIAATYWQGRQVSLRKLSVVERSRLFFLRQRSKLLQHYRSQGAADEQYAVLAAMTLGDKSALTSELRDVYSVTGASHVLALSGLHLGIIYSLLSLLVVGRRWRVITQLLIVLAIWAFVLLVGLSSSVLRAAVMLTVYALLSLGGRRKMSVSTLAFTAICLLLADPYSLYDTGFQLSFLAVLAILLFLPVADRIVPPHRLQQHTALKWLWAMFTVSLSAQLGVAPLLAYYFGRFSCYFLLTNLIVIPCAYLVLWLALTVLCIPWLTGWLLPSLASWLQALFMSCLLGVTGFMNSVLTLLSRLPGASIDGLHPTLLQVILVYVVIAALCALIPFFLKPVERNG